MTSKQQTCEQRIDAHLADLATTMRTYRDDMDVYENGNDDVPPFHEYGLSFDYVEPDTFDDQPRGYDRYQFSYGGPSDELRIYSQDRIEYWFMDWFDGASRRVESEDWVEWLYEAFNEYGMLHD